MQKMENGGSGGYWNPGNPSYSSGRFPKVSIGITLDDNAKLGVDDNRKKMAISSQNRSSPPLDNMLNKNITESESRRGNSFQFPITGILEEDTMKDNRPPDIVEPPDEDQLRAEVFEVHGKRTSELKEDSLQRTLGAVMSGRSSLEHEKNQEMQEFSSDSMQKIKMIDRGKFVGEPHKMTGENSEALRTKIWEILGTSSSQRKQAVNSPTATNPLEEFHESLIRDLPPTEPAKPRLNPDTSEPNMENPPKTRRPLTRSFSRKNCTIKTVSKPQPETKSGKTGLLSSSNSKLKNKDNILEFEGEMSKAGSHKFSFRGISSSSGRKRIEKIGEKGRIKSGEIHSPVGIRSVHSSKKKHSLASAETASIRSKNTESSGHSTEAKAPSQATKGGSRVSNAIDNPCSPMKRPSINTECFSQTTHMKVPKDATKAGSQIRNAIESPCSSAKKSDRNFQKSMDSPILKTKTFSWDRPENVKMPRFKSLQDVISSPLLTRNSFSANDIKSPTLAPERTPCPSESDMQGRAYLSPELNNHRFPLRRLFLSRSSENSPEESHGTELEEKSSDDGGVVPRFQDADEVRDTEKLSSLSPNEEQGARSFDAKCFRGKSSFSDFSNIDEAFFSGLRSSNTVNLHNKKRVNGLEDVKICKIKLPSPSAKVSEKATRLTEDREQQTDDNLARFTVELAKFLQSFKTKMYSYTSKKSSEILESTAEKLRIKMHDLDSQILEGVDKLNTASKSKRKRFESTLEAQHEQLNVIHEKFKQEIDQRLTDLKAAMEQFEAQHLELKGSAERQKASHKKLLLKVQEEMKAQLNDAESRIAAVHQEARKKMKGIKLALDEWISEEHI